MTGDSVPESLRYTDGQYIPERRWGKSGGTPNLRARRRVARFLYAIHRPWFRARLPHGVGVLTTTGRRTGQVRTTFVKAVPDGDVAYLVSIVGAQALWYKNIQAQPQVRLQLPGGTFEGLARELRDDAERKAACDAFCGRVHPFDYAENVFHRRGFPTRTKIVELHRAWFEGGLPLVVELRPGPDGDK